MPELEKFFEIKSDNIEALSPYVGMGNNPILFSDFFGDLSIASIPGLTAKQSEEGLKSDLFKLRSVDYCRDNVGIIRQPLTDLQEQHPLLFGMKSFSWLAFETLGVNKVDNFVAYLLGSE